MFLNIKNMYKYISILVLLVSVFTTALIHLLPISNFPLVVFIDVVFIAVFLAYYKTIRKTKDLSHYRWIKYFIYFVIFNSIRGIFDATNYYEYKHLLQGFLNSIIPLFAFLFFSSKLTAQVWKMWYKYAIIIYIIYLGFQIRFDPFYLSPLYFLFCFYPLFKNKTYFILAAAIFFIYESHLIDGRAPIVKVIISLMMGLSIYFIKFINKKTIKICHFVAYSSFILAFLFLLPDFVNIVINNRLSSDTNATEEYGIDTRSLLYYDIINSSVENDYYIMGRTPARGNDINYSGILFINNETDTTEFVRNERHANEFVHGNIFTWYGIIGVILYFMIYYKASTLAIHKSNNIYISLLGCYIAFRWSCGWIEDVNNFDISNIALWSMVGMCYSEDFRSMTNDEFKKWINTII